MPHDTADGKALSLVLIDSDEDRILKRDEEYGRGNV